MLPEATRMAIDDPKAAFEEQYFKEQDRSPVGLTLVAGKLAFPHATLLLEVFRKVYDRFHAITVEERLKAMWERLVQETEHLETTKVNIDDLQEAIQLALRRDAEEFNDNKRERYVKLIGNALRSEAEIHDLAAFVQTVEQLGERDITVLKVLNLVMNKPKDWQDQSGNATPRLHPNTFTQRAQELDFEIAQVLKDHPPSQNPPGQWFSHEEGYAVCARLQGFGLAHELQLSPRQVPIGDYCFRPSTRGLRLLKLLGEKVVNLEKYFSPL
jgi:hypothetical protein